MAINDYYDRHLKKKDDPYLETREKEQEFTNRIIEAVQGSVFANLPALAGMYLMSQQQNLSIPVMNGTNSMVVGTTQVRAGNGTNTIPQAKTTEVSEKVDEPKEEPLAAEELPDNDFLDADAW